MGWDAGISGSTHACCGLGLLESGYIEMPVTGEHAASVDILPHTHKDTFDRILITQGPDRGDHPSRSRRCRHTLRGANPNGLTL